MSDAAIEAAQAKWRRKEHRDMPEAEVQRRLEAALRRAGYLVMHIRDARAQNLTGFPDVVALHADGRLFVAECKTERGKTTVMQDRWLVRFATHAGWCPPAAMRVCLVRPSTLAEVERDILGMSEEEEGNGNGTD